MAARGRMCRACRTVNAPRKRKCAACGLALPKRRRPAHLRALSLTYEQYVELNGGEHCGICGAVPKPGGKKLQRDHDHRTGKPRGVLCFRDNAALRTYMTADWLRKAIAYLERAERAA